MNCGRKPTLALEFNGVRETADFGFLAQATPATSLYRVDPLQDNVNTQVTTEEHADLLLDRLPEAPATVLAYCSCSLLGAHVAARSGACLVLVDPDVIEKSDVTQAFLNVSTALGHGHAAGQDPADHEQWEKAFAAARQDLAAAQGGDDIAFELVDELFGHYRSWLRFLDACSTCKPAETDTEVVVLTAKPVPDLRAITVDQSRTRVNRFTLDGVTLDAPQVQRFLLDEVAKATHAAALDLPTYD